MTRSIRNDGPFNRGFPIAAVVGCALLLATVLAVPETQAELLSFSVRVQDDLRTAELPDTTVNGVQYVSISTLITQLGGACRTLPDRVQIDLSAKSAWLRAESTQVSASLDTFDLTQPVVKHGGDTLVAVGDVPALFERAFRLDLRRNIAVEAPATTAKEDAAAITELTVEELPPPSPLEESALTPLEPLAAKPPAPDKAPAERAPGRGRSVTRGLRVVIVDPGHGGNDPGCLGAGELRESDLVLSIARRLQKRLKNDARLEVHLTREEDRRVSLRERISLANSQRGDLLISLHAGASFASQAHGVELFCCPGEGAATAVTTGTAYAARSQAIAGPVAQALAAETGAVNRGVRTAPLLLLKDAAMPAVLVEVGFLTNPDEAALLKTDAYQEKIAAGIARGVLQGPDGAATEGDAR
ncbi:MAG: hypothetical protein GWP08_02740 [Nitrospiraceae bacterium]|nr:hypothetical protein [Nitrospiraceae bacterium]